MKCKCIAIIDGVEVYKGCIPDEYFVSPAFRWQIFGRDRGKGVDDLVFVVKEEDTVTAILSGYIYKDTAYIATIESFGRGLGSKLVKAFEKYAKSKGIMIVELHYSLPEARGFWEKLGYSYHNKSLPYSIDMTKILHNTKVKRYRRRKRMI